MLVEGWNIGWETNWARQYFTRPTADSDAVGLAAYAKSKGVVLIGHHETGGASSWYDDQMEAAFAYSASLGQRAVKTGYVADAGQIERIDEGRQHREWHDGQWQVNHHKRVVMAAAKHRVAVNAHEPVKDTGLRRTYPNWTTREGARGMEYNAWIGKKNPPEHEANLAFTRMLTGPMDFTPGVLSLTGEKGSAILTEVLKGIDLASEDGEFLVFVGPSGCGKSTLLRVIAGLEDLDAGDVEIGGVRVNDLPPSQRGIAMVFQSYALYPHMTVAENLGFSLKLTGMPKAEIAEAVTAAAATLDIGHLLARKPGALSGGQRQRVAIGRAIVRKPKVFLFDEPLSNLDAALRVRMRYEFASLHKALATTMIYVTHDQAER